MKTETRSISEFLSRNSTAFFIPPFQRSYAWGTNEIKRYFEDIKRIIESELSDDKDKLEHFFGTLVTKDTKMSTIKDGQMKYSNVTLIIDGQQRLTTTLIFLIALRDKVANDEEKERIKDDYLINHKSDFEDKIKLKQVTKDWDNYKALIKGEKAQPSIIKNAYDNFCNLIEKYQNENQKVSFENYVNAIEKLNVANIILDERTFKGEDPQIIFETLNSLGKPLTLSDLIRNYVLLKQDANKQSEIYNNEWFPKIEQELGEKSSEFFRDFLQYKKSVSIKVVSDNNTKEIYADFKNFVETNYKNHDDFIKDIISYAPLYKLIITEINTAKISDDETKNNKIIELLRNIFWDIKSEIFNSFVLGILDYYRNGKFSDDDLIQNLSAIRTYLIRRRVTKLSKGENKAIPALSKRIDDLANGNISMFELLATQSYNVRLPNDDEVKKALQEAKFYEDYKKISKFILRKIEEHNSKVFVDCRDKAITIEHIMPQTLTKEWQEMLSIDCESIHNQYLHNIGNLILTEFNSEIGNKPFNEKKKKLEESNLNYRNEILKLEKWSKDEIQNHQNKMINNFLKTFDLPEKYQNTPNYAIKEEEIKSFSPLDEDASDIAESRKPINIKVNEQIFKVSNWQDVLITFLTFIKENKNFGLEIVLNNQNEIFGKDDIIINWDRLEKKIDEEPKLKDRYKSFDGLIPEKIPTLKNTELFIHTNISANTCVKRIASVMNKFNMSNDFVIIELKI